MRYGMNRPKVLQVPRAMALALAMATFLLPVGVTLAQDADEPLNGLDWMVGELTSEMVFDGTHLKILTTTEWLHDKKFLSSKWRIMHDGGVAHEREITWYWDPMEKIVRNQKFDSDGEWGQATIDVRCRQPTWPKEIC